MPPARADAAPRLRDTLPCRFAAGPEAPPYLAPLKAELEKIEAHQAALLGDVEKVGQAAPHTGNATIKIGDLLGNPLAAHALAQLSR